MNRPSLKKHIITMLAAYTQQQPNKVILVTATGLISGKLAELYVEGEGATYIPEKHAFSTIVTEAVKLYKEENKVEGFLEGNDGYVLLSDATILNGADTTNLVNLVVFFDQIIGVTFGELTRKS